MISNTKHQKLVLVITVSLFLLNSVFAQDPFTIAKNLFAQKKYDLALLNLKMAYKKQPGYSLTISDICFAEGASLIKSGNKDIAVQLCNFGLEIIQTNSLPISQNLYKYLEAINNSDSVFKIVTKLISTSSYDVLASTLMQLNPSDSKEYVAKIYSSNDGHSEDLWLYPPNTIFSSIPLITYYPKATSILANTSISEITSITPKAFIRSVREDRMFLTDGLTNDLNFSSIPELKDIFNQLRDKNDLQIAAARESVIKEIVNVRDKYLIVNLNYIFTKFNIPGCCTAYLRDYNVDKQELDLHLSISYDFAEPRAYEPEGIYIATVRIKLSLEEAQKYFGNGEGHNYNIWFKVKPGIKRQSLGILGGGSRWEMPNLFLLEDPEYSLTNNDGYSIKFKCLGLKGELWPPNLDTYRWDLNNVGRPRTARILNGINQNTQTVISTNTQNSNSNDISSLSVTSNDIQAFWESFQIALSNNDSVFIKSVMNSSIIYNNNGDMITITKNQLFTECSDIFSENQKEELLKVTSLEKVTRFAYNDFFPTDKKDYKLKDFSSLYRVGTMYNNLSLYFTKFQGEIKLFAIETYWE